MLKTKQRDLKIIIADNKGAIKLRCAECLGFFVDGYEKCTDIHCPLFISFPTSSEISKGEFIDKMIKLAKDRGNDISFIKKIGRKRDLSS